MDRDDDRRPLTAADADGGADSGEAEGRVLSVHFGRSANCSSVGSVVDVLFVSSVVGSALLASLAVLVRKAVRSTSEPEPEPESASEPEPASEPESESEPTA